MFHKSNLGRFATIVAPFADIGGYVPEPGDSPSQLLFEEPNGFDDPDVWNGFVGEAARLTREANSGVESWQDNAEECG